MRQLS